MRLPNQNSATANLIKVALWVGVSSIITWFIGSVTQHPELYNPATVLVVNAIGKFAIDFINKDKPNY